MKPTQALAFFGLVVLLTFQVERSSAVFQENAELAETDTDDVIAYKPVGRARVEWTLEECEERLQKELPNVGHVSGIADHHLRLRLGEIRRQALRICEGLTAGALRDRAVKVHLKATESLFIQAGHPEWKPEIPLYCKY